MQFTTLIISTVLALAPAGALAWAKNGQGVWTANNVVYSRVGNYNNVHESCTRMNSNIVLTSGDCAYWIDSHGGISGGQCVARNNKVECVRGCPDPFSVCQYVNDNGTCDYGYSACLQTMGCSNRAGEADCLGLAAGTLFSLLLD
jgi:hypothetical protein